MKKILFLLMSAFVALSVKAQFDIKYRANDNYYLIKYGLDTTHVIPKGTTYAKLQYGNEVGLFYNSGQPIVNYVSHFLYNINGASVATPNALMDSLSLILGMPLDSVGGGGIAGVEHINGKDGDLKIIAGSNVTIDNSKSDTIVINAIGGDFIPLSGTEPTNPVTGEIVSIGGSEHKHFKWLNNQDTSYIGNIAISNTDDGFVQLTVVDRDSAIMYMSTDGTGLGFYYVADSVGNPFFTHTYITLDKNTNDFVISNNSNNGDAFSFKGNNVFVLKDSTNFIQKHHLDSAIAEVSISGNYLPLNIQDSTTVELNGNSVIFKGDNHSLALNRPFDALAIGGAIMDGFQAQQYDSIYTMNGVMKIPMIFGDTIRYPILFMSEGMPMADYYKSALFKPIFSDYAFGFNMVLNNQEDININHYFTDGGYVLSENDNENIILSANGDITATGEIKGTSYITKTSPNSYAQMQDVTDLTSPNIITVYDSTYYIDPDVSSIVTLFGGSEDVYLPDVSQSIGMSIYIINSGSNGVDINSFTANDDIFSSGSWVSSIIIPSYSTMKLINNGSYWVIF